MISNIPRHAELLVQVITWQEMDANRVLTLARRRDLENAPRATGKSGRIGVEVEGVLAGPGLGP